MVKHKQSCLNIEVEVLPYAGALSSARQLSDHLGNQLIPEILSALGLDYSSLDSDEVDMLMESIETRDCVINGTQVWHLVQSDQVLLSWVFTQATSQSDPLEIGGGHLGSDINGFIKSTTVLSLEAYIFDTLSELHDFIANAQGRASKVSREAILLYPGCPTTEIEVSHHIGVAEINLSRLMSEDFVNLLNPPKPRT